LPHSAWRSSANYVVGSFYQTWSNVSDYFFLRSENERLVAENVELQNYITRLENQLEGLFESQLPDTVPAYVYAEKDLRYIPAKVINFSTSSQRNYLTLNKGARDGVEENMGVVDQDGVVGIVRAVSDRFSVVIPVINNAFSVSCRFLSNDKLGPLHWDGIDYRYAQLEDIARHVEVHEGDTLVTSGLSDAFPEGVRVGVVEKAELGESDAYYHIKVRLAADFHRLGYVQIIQNRALIEQRQLEEWGNK
jgi:rod shape-determining protein MreC